jgi:hypothetical protein
MQRVRTRMLRGHSTISNTLLASKHSHYAGQNALEVFRLSLYNRILAPGEAAEMEFVTVRCQLVSSLTPDINLSQVNPHFKFQLLYHFCLDKLQVSLQFQKILFYSI